LLQPEPLLESLEPLAQLPVLALELIAPVVVARLEPVQRRVRLPPIDPHLARTVDRRDQQPELDREQLDVEQVDLDVACDDDALVEHALEDVGEVGAVGGAAGQAGGAAARQVGTLHGYSASSAWPRTKRRVRL
jgi:hypothetical protein